MKKKLFGCLTALALILTTAACLVACNFSSRGVSLHGKTYTLGTEVTWSCYTGASYDNKTKVNDEVSYINEHWNVIGTNSLSVGSQNGQQLVEALKARILDPNDTYGSDVLLRGATITIGKENKKTEKVWESTFECTMNNELIVRFDKIFTDTLNKDRYKANKDGSGQFNFELTHYNSSTKSISNIYTRFCVPKTINNGSGNNTINIYYSNVSYIQISLGNGQFLFFEGKVDLARVS